MTFQRLHRLSIRLRRQLLVDGAAAIIALAATAFAAGQLLASPVLPV